MSHLSFELDSDLHRQLKIDCARSGATVAEVVRGLIRAHLQRHPKSEPEPRSSAFPSGSASAADEASGSEKSSLAQMLERKLS